MIRLLLPPLLYLDQKKSIKQTGCFRKEIQDRESISRKNYAVGTAYHL